MRARLEHRAAGAVVDVGEAVVAPADDPVADRHGDRPVVDVVAELAQRADVLARGGVERRARVVVAGDEHRLRGAVLAGGALPVLQRRGDRAVVGVHGNALVLLSPLQVGAGAAVVQMRQRAALVDVALAHDLRQAVHADALADLAHPAAGLHRGQLPGVADRDHLGAGELRGAQQPLGAARGRHAGLVEQHHGALGQRVAVAQVQQRPVERPRRHAGLLGQLAHRAAGRGDADDVVAGVLVDLAQRAGGERLAGAGQGLDDVDAVARRRHAAQRLGLLVRQRPVHRRHGALEHGPIDDGRALAGAPDRRGDQPPLGGDEVLRGQPAGDGVEHVAAAGEAHALLAHVAHPRALLGGAGVLAQHVALRERVGLLGQTLLAGEPVADRALVDGHGAELAIGQPRPAAVDELLDRVAIEPVLAGARADLLAPRVRLDAVLLALAGQDRQVLAALAGQVLDAGLASGLDDLLAPAREHGQHLGGQRSQVGGALAHRPPLQPEPIAHLGAQVRLVEVAGGLGVLVEMAAVERGPAAVRAARDVGADHVRVQLRVQRARHPVPVGRGDHALARLDDRAALAAPHLDRRVLDVLQRRAHGRLVRARSAARRSAHRRRRTTPTPTWAPRT